MSLSSLPPQLFPSKPALRFQGNQPDIDTAVAEPEVVESKPVSAPVSEPAQPATDVVVKSVTAPVSDIPLEEAVPAVIATSQSWLDNAKKVTEQASNNMKAAFKSRFRRPDPNILLMKLMGPINRMMMLKGIPGMRHIPILRDIPGIRGFFKIRRTIIPAEDRARLEAAVNKNTAAFMGPNHPEFMTDWVMDKEISSRVAPNMAGWAAHEIVNNMMPGFWSANNLIANNGGPDAKAYSVEWALKSKHVALHPEGTVRWTADHVWPIFDGLGDMSIQAVLQARIDGIDKPVNSVPMLSKYQFTGDVTKELHKEMALIEDRLKLPKQRWKTTKETVSSRFEAMQVNILEQQMRTYGFEPAAITGKDFFERQANFQKQLVDKLTGKYEIEPTDDIDKKQHRLYKAVADAMKNLKNDTSLEGEALQQRKNELQQDMDAALEVRRLSSFARNIYNTPRLSQEQIAESLKRNRCDLLKSGLGNMLHRYMPKPIAPRIAHIGIPEPINVSQWLADLEARDESVKPVIAKATELLKRKPADQTEKLAIQKELDEQIGILNDKMKLTATIQERMQKRLDKINADIAGEVLKFAHPNPFCGATAV